ncbi:uncharacterized protein LOC144631640 [Oculina patagonica]
MIDNVMSICPDVDRKDVAKDLVITGSATRTINRILDGQFPTVVNIDFDAESTSSETRTQDQVKRCAADSATSKSSTASVNRAKSQQSNNDSSDTDVYTDTDDDDDIMIVQEERKSLFSALKSRMNDRKSDKSCSKQSKPSEVTTAKETSCHVGEENKKMSTKHKRTSAIVDLSSSDDDSQEEQNSLHSYAAKSRKTTQDDCVLVKKQKPHTSKAGPPYQNKNARKEYFEKYGKKFVDSSPSDHDTDSCEDSDDLPCVLPSSLHSGSEGSSHSFTSSCTDNYKSSDSRMQRSSNLESQEDSEIPGKRKKRSPEEIIRQRNDALLKKQAKEQERQAKKEAIEKEQQARAQARGKIKMAKDKEKLLKKAESMNQKNNRLDGCIKQIVVCIDPEILTNGQLPEESVLLQKLDSLGASHKTQSQQIPGSITWQRACLQHDVQSDTLQISTKTSFTDEKHAVVRLSAIKFVEMVFQFREEMQNPTISVIADEETLCTFSERALAIYPGKIITIVVLGLEKYCRDVKVTQQRHFRSAVLGPSSSDTENTSGKGRKKSKKESGPSVMVSRVDVEEALVDLQIKQPKCRVRMCETDEEFVELLTMFTKAVAEAPFKKKQPESFSFCVEGGEKGSVKVTKEGEGLKKVWQQHFQQFRNVSADMAAAIVAVYPSPQSLFQAYKRCNSTQEASKLLQDIQVRRGAGVLATSRRIGPELSRRIHLLLTSEDGDQSMK